MHKKYSAGRIFSVCDRHCTQEITRQTTIASTSVSQGTIRKTNISPNKGNHSLQILSVTEEQNPSAAQTDCRDKLQSLQQESVNVP